MNKNQKRIRVESSKSDVAIEVPAGGYHNENKGRFVVRRISLVKYKHVAKAKPFPKPNPDVDMSITAQRKIVSW